MKRFVPLLLLAASTSAVAQVDRTVPPPPGPEPSVDFPTIERRALSNGLPVYIVERPGVPLVTVRLVVNAGSAAEPGTQPGLASLTADMLDEGTTRRTAPQIADELEFLGANLGTGASYDASFVVLNTLSRNLRPALDIFADVVTNPAFAAPELERVRNQRLAALLQQQDQPVVLANQEFASRIFGTAHPYGRPLEGTPAAIRAFRPEALRTFHTTYYRPGNASLVVVGDVSAAEVMNTLQAALGSWSGGAATQVRYPAAPRPQAATRVYLIDKPGSAQSEIRIGQLGVARNHPDHYPLLVMNSILGGQFSSRINLNLREDKGYTYGARSGFAQRREAGPFTAQAGVQTQSTRESVIEFMRELQEIREGRPATQQEVEFAKASLVRAEPLRLETNNQVASRIEDIILYGLPLDYYDTYTQRVQAVTPADVARVARQYLTPDRFAIVVVGDRSRVEAGLRQLPYPVQLVTTTTAR
ncbi:MAG: insulinase family protein [Gemmatimonadota bacterium]|nr:insulinase family protein [Gemmatimonadota bacterium]